MPRLATFLRLVLLVSLSATPLASSEHDSLYVRKTGHNRCCSHSTVLDSLQVVVTIPSEADSHSSWLKYLPLIAPLIGTFGAGIIAYLSVRASFRSARQLEDIRQKLEQAKERSRYSGIVYALHSTLHNHKRQLEQLREAISALRETVSTSHSIPVTELGVEINLAFLTQCVLDYLKHTKYETRLTSYLITYLHSAHNLNEFLSFSQLTALRGHFPNDKEYWKAVDEYFEKLIKRAVKLYETAGKMIDLLEKELEKDSANTIVRGSQEVNGA